MKDCRRGKDLPDYKGETCLEAPNVMYCWESPAEEKWSCLDFTFSKCLIKIAHKMNGKRLITAAEIYSMCSSNDRLTDHFHSIKEGIASGEDDIKLAESGGK